MFTWSYDITVTVKCRKCLGSISFTDQRVWRLNCCSITMKLRACVGTQECLFVPNIQGNTAGLYSSRGSQCGCSLSLLPTGHDPCFMLSLGCTQEWSQMVLVGWDLSCHNKDTKNKTVWMMRSTVFEVALCFIYRKVHFINMLSLWNLLKPNNTFYNYSLLPQDLCRFLNNFVNFTFKQNKKMKSDFFNTSKNLLVYSWWKMFIFFVSILIL